MEEQEQELTKIIPIYTGDLDFNTIKENPILKPIAEINETFINLELMINKAFIEYQEIEEAINEMIKENSVYSETILMSKIQLLKNNVKQIIYSQDLQKTNMKSKINEMIKIVEEEYDVRRDEEEIIFDPKEKEKDKKTEVTEDEEDTFKKLKEMVGETDEKEEGVYSSLVERKIPTKDG